MTTIKEIAGNTLVNLFVFIKGTEIIFRTSKVYEDFDEAVKYKDIKPDAGWQFVEMVPAGLFPIQKNFTITEK